MLVQLSEPLCCLLLRFVPRAQSGLQETHFLERLANDSVTEMTKPHRSDQQFAVQHPDDRRKRTGGSLDNGGAHRI
jgi:hypothetical protein